MLTSLFCGLPRSSNPYARPMSTTECFRGISGEVRIDIGSAHMHFRRRKEAISVTTMKGKMMGTTTVMLVDDNPIFLRILARFLEEESGGDVVVVGSVIGGGDAVARARALRPHVILLDLDMPGQSGLDLRPSLRGQMPDAVIIVLTMMDPESYRELALAAGADDFVQKALLERHLLPTIRRLTADPRSLALAPSA